MAVKRGMFFSMIAIVMVMAIIALFVPNQEYVSLFGKVTTVKTRVGKANSFLVAVQKTMIQRALYNSGHYAVKAMVAYVNKTKQPIDLADFDEILLNGTVGGVELADMGISFMVGRGLAYRLEEISNMSARELRLDNTFTVNDVLIVQDNETGYKNFYVGVNLSVWVDADIATWNSTFVVLQVLDVEDYYDPYWIMNRDIYRGFYFANVSNWSTSLFYDFAGSLNYSYDGRAPSFLMRFENSSMGSECCGVETIMDPVAFGIDDEPWSYVDYCYFGRQCNGSKATDKSLWNITGISSVVEGENYYQFKLEVYHIDKYNLSVDRRVVQLP
ncbi:MAG: hypothetical protein ABIG95_06705 [Candidatus Woesearchaeota archaeon]